LLGVGIAFFLVGYGVYAFFLGGIDGLAPLPDDYQIGDVGPLPPAPPDEEIDRKLQMAFGPQCPQIKKTIKFEVRKKGMVIAATQAYFNEPDGRVKLIDLSLALFKDKFGAKIPEINTLQSDVAWLTFDQPIRSPTDTSKAKIVGAELRGNIIMINNRCTPEKSDDLEVLVDDEPLFYDERNSRITTNGFVSLLDKQTRPDPTKISGHGLEMLLSKDNPDDKKSAVARPKGDSSGIDKITLKSTVEMHLYPDSNSGFLGSSQKPTGAAVSVQDGQMESVAVELKPGKKKEPEKAHVYIKTGGQFIYDVQRDVAVFESGKPNQVYPDRVCVVREPIRPHIDDKDKSYDQLDCDHLTLKFARKVGPTGNRDSTDREIQSAHAKAGPGMEVVVAMDSEKLDCHCAELTYECPIPGRGARTVLTGKPLEAAKDGHKIKCRELMLVQADSNGKGQHVVAQGPGQVDLFDHSSGKECHNTHAIWKGLLTSEKDWQNNKEMDKLILTEDAAFIDDEHEQKLFGQRLQVWLENVDPVVQATPAKEPDNGLTTGGSRQRPYKVEAYERVRAESPDFTVNDCSSLKMYFKEGTPNLSLPSVLPADTAATTPPPNTDPGPPPPPGKGPTSNPVAGSPPADVKQNEKPKRPIDLRARDVTADILRTGEKNDLQKLVAEGNVHVHQEGETPQDKGVDIKGEMLDLLHFVEGDILKVYGNRDGPAELQLGDLFLVGPKVTINQKDNTSWVEGVGAMHMPSNTTFDGGKPSKPGTRLVVHWTRDMIFNGRDADFHGGVVAYQENSTLQCKTLQVALDRVVSFKEGQKKDQQAKVENVIAHGEVRVFDEARDEKDNSFISSRHLFCSQLAVDNLDNRFNASGPGQAATLQYGQPDVLGPGAGGPKQPAAAPPKPPELQLTRVDFQDRMFSTYLNSTTRKTTFLGSIQVVHFPANQLDAKVDVNKLPKGGMLMQCDQLIVVQRQLGEGKSTQNMEAQKRVFCRTIDMYGRAEKLVFDESQDIVTFTGSPGNPAQVYQQAVPGGEWKKTEAQLIRYNRKTGAVTVEGGSGANFGTWLKPAETYRPLGGDLVLFESFEPTDLATGTAAYAFWRALSTRGCPEKSRTVGSSS
jgi:hypothetical protein